MNQPDLSYTWGLPPSTYLAPRQIARLTILRSRLQERQDLRKRKVKLSRPRRARLTTS